MKHAELITMEHFTSLRTKINPSINLKLLHASQEMLRLLFG